MNGKNTKPSRRGFASMTPERQREIASQGGRAAHSRGTAHKWNREEAKLAGQKGGPGKGKKLNLKDDDAQKPG